MRFSFIALVVLIVWAAAGQPSFAAASCGGDFGEWLAAFKKDASERKLARHRASLANLDATIRLYAPELDPDTIPPKRAYRRTRYFAKGELSRPRPVVLRQASGKPMRTAAITCAIVADKGFPIGDGALSEAVTDMILTVLRRLGKRETVIKSGTSRNAQWVLAPSLL
jgi:hypothetical protein